MNSALPRRRIFATSTEQPTISSRKRRGRSDVIFTEVPSPILLGGLSPRAGRLHSPSPPDVRSLPRAPPRERRDPAGSAGASNEPSNRPRWAASLRADGPGRIPRSGSPRGVPPWPRCSSYGDAESPQSRRLGQERRGGASESRRGGSCSEGRLPVGSSRVESRCRRSGSNECVAPSTLTLVMLGMPSYLLLSRRLLESNLPEPASDGNPPERVASTSPCRALDWLQAQGCGYRGCDRRGGCLLADRPRSGWREIAPGLVDEPRRPGSGPNGADETAYLALRGAEKGLCSIPQADERHSEQP